MYEDAIKIFDYLPIRASENEIGYISHLWSCFSKIYNENENEISTKTFSIMPFHILFMLVLQYKVLRIKNQRYEQYKERIKKYPKKEEIGKQLLNTMSVYDLGLMSETSLCGFLNIIGVSETTIQKIKNLINHRNDAVAHAKGGFTFDVDQKISDYLDCLFEIQKCMKILNNEIAESWLAEIEDEEDLEDFKERKLASSYICIEDFNLGHMQLLENNSKVPFSQWLDTDEREDDTKSYGFF